MVRRTLTLPVAPAELWPTLTDPDRAGRWLGGAVEWDLVRGGALRWQGDDGERRDGEVTEIEPGRLLRFTWWRDDGDDATEVTWTLQPREAGTDLTVEEAPLRWTPADDAALAAWSASACATR